MEPVGGTSHIAIAKIVRTRGNRGEVLAELHTDFPARFQHLDKVWLEFPDRRRQRMTLELSWPHQGRQVLKFAGIDTIDAAERIVGAWVQVDVSQAVPLPEGTYYDHDLVGCAVRTLSGEHVGRVEDVLRIKGNTQLVVRGRRGEFLVPATAAICQVISIERKEILVDLPEGMIDLNE